VDYVLPLAFANSLINKEQKRSPCLGIGADADSSFFYPKTRRGREDMKLVGFKSLTILRPASSAGSATSRVLQKTCSDAVPNTGASSSKKFHVNPSAKIAGVLLDSVIAGPGLSYRYAEV